MKKINKKAIELMTTKGFDRAFFNELKNPEIKTQRQAYQKLEEIFFENFGRNRYSSFDSYRNSRNIRLKAGK